MANNSYAIDFVIPWVDGSDKEWRKCKRAYMPMADDDDSEERYRDWESLRYWFRGVENCAPWVRKIHFITWGHIPAWLNTEHPKLNIVRHEDYIPEEYLPTFSANPIELNLHRIKGLSEHFVYINDDMYLLDRVSPEYFFHKGKPCDMLALQPVVANKDNPVMSHIFINNSLTLCKYFDKRSNVMVQPEAYFRFGYPAKYFIYNLLELTFPRFTGFYTVHGPSPFLKSTFTELWDKEGELLRETCTHRFRSKDDVNQYLFREWQKLSGNFYPSPITAGFRFFSVKDNNSSLVNHIINHASQVICINDDTGIRDFEKVKRQINSAWQYAFPVKSSFEK